MEGETVWSSPGRGSPFDQARVLLHALLAHWPFPAGPSSPSLLLCGPSGNGKTHLVRAVASESGRLCLVTPALAPAVSVRDGDGRTGLRRCLRQAVRAARRRSPSTPASVLLLLDHVECFAAAAGEAALPRDPAFVTDLYTLLRGGAPLFSAAEAAREGLHRLVYVALFTGTRDEVDPLVRDRCFDVCLALPTPTEAERRVFFGAHVAPSADSRAAAHALAARTGGVTYSGLVEVAAHAAAAAADVSAGAEEENVSAWARAVVQAFQSSGSVSAMAYRAGAGCVDVPETRWGDVAGMERVKETLRRLVTHPRRHRACYERYGVQPSSGVLLCGPPGTGKTMLAKAMATELDAAFVYIHLPELLQAEVGESERRLTDYFAAARERRPAVLFVDELQAAFAGRYATGASATTPHDARLVSHLLHLLDVAHAEAEGGIVFVGATNVRDRIDPLVCRAGRLDVCLEVPRPEAVARDRLVSHVLEREWALWFDEAGEAAGPLAAARAAARETLRAALVAHSEGFSGAELRHALSLFGWRLLRQGGGDGAKVGPALWEALWDRPWGPADGTAPQLSETGRRLVREACTRPGDASPPVGRDV